MGSVAKWLALDKVGNFWKIVKHNNGIFGTLFNIFRMDSMKHGKFVGEDKYGNRYFQNNYYFYGRNRWVEYNSKVYFDYDGSQIPAEWHNWMHYISDIPPTIQPPITRPWMIDHTENLSGTNKAYVPYSTTPPKIELWTFGGQRPKIGPPK